MEEKKKPLLFRIIKATVQWIYPKTQVEGTENIPNEPVIYVGNHCHMHGPIVGELYMPGAPYIWCAGQMMHLKDVPDYAYQDFWSYKPRWSKWFYRLCSYLIAPLSVHIFNNARTIGVYHDTRILSTFKKTVAKLSEGESVLIFPEHDADHNHIVCDFQDKFIDVAKLYYKRTGKAVCFVPVYIAPELKKIAIGMPTRFQPDAPMDAERSRICEYLMAGVTELACNLPEHTVIPYRNVSKKEYVSNIPKE